MKAILIFSAILLGSFSAQAKDLVCEYTAFSIKTGLNIADETLSIEADDDKGAELELAIGKFGDMDVSAWQLYGGPVIIAKKGDLQISSTVNAGRANLRLETADEIYEVFCEVK